MLRALNKLFGGRSGLTKTAPSAKTLPLEDVEDEEIPRYPPFAKGLPVAPLDKILATQAELIEKIRNSLGFAVDDFNLLVLPVIQRYAAFVHLLPASESHHHRGAGGLFRHGLEVAFWSAQISESVIFSIEGTPRERRENEPRWRLASCLSGLLHDVGKPISDVSVTNKDGAITWNPYSGSILDWANHHKVDRYFIRWRDKRHKRHEQFSLLAVDRIIPSETREFLSQSGPSIMEAMLEAISGTSVNEPVTKLMLRADQESVSRDLRQSRLNVDEFSYGVPVERYVFDAIRRLVKTGKWKVNEPGAKVWHLNQGVFIAWKQLGDLYDVISHDKIPGIPRDPDTLADILIERGFAIPNTVQEKGERAYYRYWEVSPEMLQDVAGPVKILMLRLESNDLVFTTEPPAPVAAEVVGEVEDAESSFADSETDGNKQQEGEAPQNKEMLVPEQAPDKAFSDLSIDDAMELLKSTSLECSEKFDDAEDKKNIDSTEKGSPRPREKEIDKVAPHLQNNNPLQGHKDISVGFVDVDFPFEAFNLTTDKNCASETNPDGQVVTEPDQPKSDSASKEQNLIKKGNLSIFTGTEESLRLPADIPSKIDCEDENTPGKQEISIKDKSSQPAKDTKAELVAMLENYGSAGELLEQAILPVLEGKTTLGEVLCLMEGQAVILYPDGARSLGEPSEVLSKLFDANAIVPDPIMPGRKIRDFRGIKAIVLEEQLSNAVVAAIKDVEASMEGYQDAMDLISTGSKANKNKSAKKGLSGKQSKSDHKPDSSTEKKEIAQKKKTKQKKNPTKLKKVNDSAPIHIKEHEAISDGEKQNIARLRKQETKLVTTELSSDKKLKKIDKQEIREFELPKAKTSPKDINEEDFLPSSITPQKAIQMLKDMINKRSGRWLVTPVIEEDGYLVTSDKAFDMIAGENVGISKHILCGMLSRAQRRPLLKKRQGKLYLEVNDK